MVAFCVELWFNMGMLKTQAIELLGGSTASAAAAIGISYQAVDKWPERLTPRLADRVLAACIRCGIAIPPELTYIPTKEAADA